MQITTRDIGLFWWLNSFGAVTLAQIAAWMMVDTSTAARRVRKLIEAGLLRRLNIPFLITCPIVPTVQACALARDPLVPLSGIRTATWRHEQFLVDAERNLEQHFGGWLEPERRVRASRKHDGVERAHLPDAIIHRPGGALIAIEIELSAKAPARLQEIIDDYATSNRFEQVAYITDDAKLAAYLKKFTSQFDFIKIGIYRAPEQLAAPVTTSKKVGRGNPL